MRHNLRVEIAQANFAAVDHCWEVLEEELLPDLVIDLFNLKKVARHEFIQAILRSDLQELGLHSEVDFFWRHLLVRLAVLISFFEFESIVGLDLDDVDQPVESI